MPNYVDTADATATPNDLKSGETAYVRGAKITGTQGFSVSGNTLICPSDWYVDGDTLVIPESWMAQNGS